MIEIKKTDYTANKWRLFRDGMEIEMPRIIESGSGEKMRVWGSVGGETKTACINEALALLDRCLDELQKIHDERAGG